MKRCISTTIAAVSLLAASCTVFNDSVINDIQNAEPVYASIGEDTRTIIGEKDGNAYKVEWETGDRILISTGISSSAKSVYITSESGTPSAAFLPEEGEASVDFSQGAIAGYPVENMYLGMPDSDKEVYFTIPDIQSHIPGSFDSGAMPMISDVTEKPELHFHNAAGVIRLRLSSEEQDIAISSITITSSASLSGECGYIPKSRKIFFDESMVSNNYVTLQCEEGAVLSENDAFHLVVPHQTYKDMIITVMTSDNRQQTFTMKSGKEISVGRSSIVTIPLVLDKLVQAGEPKVWIKVTGVTFEHIRVEVAMDNITSYYCGIQTKLAFNRDLESGELLESLPYKSPYTSPLSYSGNISHLQSELGDILIEPGQSYVIWFVPYKQSGIYTPEDIVYVETMTRSYSAGGTKEITYYNLKTDYTGISMMLQSAGASAIYCQLLTPEQMNMHISESDLIKMLLEPGGRSTVFDNDCDLFERKFLNPGTEMTLVALAIDRLGKYGPLFMEVFKTNQIPYNSLEINIIENIEDSGSISWEVSGGDAAQYRYICRETDSYLWKNTLGASVLKAQETMFLDPGLYYINSVNTPSASLDAAVSGEEYIIIVTAVDEDGNISVADSWTFEY